MEFSHLYFNFFFSLFMFFPKLRPVLPSMLQKDKIQQMTAFKLTD